MKKLFIVVLILMMDACRLWETSEDQAEPYKKQVDDVFPQKKVIMIILDSMMGSSLDKSLEEGMVPSLG